MQLGPIAEWGLNLDKKTVPVNTESFETNKEGIFAIGDICSYPGKLKLILSGFHEGALAARGCFKYAKPDEKYRFEFTTSSKTVKDRLVLKSDRIIHFGYSKWKKNYYIIRRNRCNFKVTVIDLSKDDQFKTDFKKISPFSKIPVIVDHENKDICI